MYCGVFICNQKHDRKGLSENSSKEIVKEHYKYQGHQMKAASKAHSRMCLFTQYVGTLWKSLLQDAVDTTSSQGLKPAKQMCGKRTKKCNKDTRSAPESPPNNKLWDTGEHLGDVSLYICLQVMLFACVISHCWRQAAGLQEPLVWHGTAVPPLWMYTFAWWGQKEAADSQQSVPEGTPQLGSGSIPQLVVHDQG